MELWNSVSAKTSPLPPGQRKGVDGQLRNQLADDNIRRLVLYAQLSEDGRTQSQRAGN